MLHVWCMREIWSTRVDICPPTLLAGRHRNLKHKIIMRVTGKIFRVTVLRVRIKRDTRARGAYAICKFLDGHFHAGARLEHAIAAVESDFERQTFTQNGNFSSAFPKSAEALSPVKLKNARSVCGRAWPTLMNFTHGKRRVADTLYSLLYIPLAGISTETFN